MRLKASFQAPENKCTAEQQPPRGRGGRMRVVTKIPEAQIISLAGHP
jgi:hypothetical protein